MTLEELEHRLRSAYQGDGMWTKLHSRPKMARSPRYSPAFGLAVGVLVLLIGGVSWLTGTRLLNPAPHPAYHVEVVSAGPVRPIWNTNVQQLAAALATETQVRHPSQLFWSTLTVHALLRLFPHLNPGGYSSHTQVHLLLLTGQVRNQGDPQVLKPVSLTGTVRGGVPAVAGAGYEIFSTGGTLLAVGSVRGLSPRALAKAHIPAQRLFWPANWGYRLWASPWGRPSPAQEDADLVGTSYVVVSRQLRLSLAYPVPLRSAVGTEGLPARGPLYLIETPAGASWYIDGTTGARFSVAWPGGWFPLSHYGVVHAAPQLPATGPPGT